jgi:hypothetical protein
MSFSFSGESATFGRLPSSNQNTVLLVLVGME